jgi:hypothetical protein
LPDFSTSLDSSPAIFQQATDPAEDLRANQGLQVPHEIVYRSLAHADSAAIVSVVTGFMPRFS